MIQMLLHMLGRPFKKDQLSTNAKVHKRILEKFTEETRKGREDHLVEGAHGGRGGGDDVVDKEEESVLWPQANPLPD